MFRTSEEVAADVIADLRRRVAELESRDSYARPTAGSVLFAGTNGVIAQDNTNLLWDDTNNRLTVTGWIFLGAGSSFPASPPTNGVYYRTDLGLLCYYDGTRWLTFNVFSAVLNVTTVSASQGVVMAPLRQDFAPYVVRVTTQYTVPTTSNGSNYWTITLRGLNAAYSAASNIDQFTTAALTAGTWASNDASPSVSATPSNRAFLESQALKTGAPGNLSWAVAAFYRLILT